MVEMRIADQVGPIERTAADRPNIGDIHVRGERKRLPGPKLDNAVDSPGADNAGDDSIAHPALAVPERQFIDDGCGKVVRNVEAGNAPRSIRVVRILQGKALVVKLAR